MHRHVNRLIGFAARALDWLLAPPPPAFDAALQGRPPAWSDKIKEWLARYLPLEIAATVTALVGGLLASLLTANAVAIAYAAAWCENIGYYVLAFSREMRGTRTQAPGDAGSPSTPRRALNTATNLALEFGPAELVDSLISRPFCVYMACWLFGSVGLGIIIGKFAGDIIFYGLAIIAYEVRKKNR